MKRKISVATTFDLQDYSLEQQSYKPVKFKSLYPVLESSLEENRTWVSDFQDDVIYVPNDLSDIIAAYEHFYGQLKKTG
ncbi:MAG: hypothetical protein VX438_17620 [Planctomycetota bacterium]|jgi:hypothetical protein|nr:hypothetical protein [Planctomycetota bacterium]